MGLNQFDALAEVFNEGAVRVSTRTGTIRPENLQATDIGKLKLIHPPRQWKTRNNLIVRSCSTLVDAQMTVCARECAYLRRELNRTRDEKFRAHFFALITTNGR